MAVRAADGCHAIPSHHRHKRYLARLAVPHPRTYALRLRPQTAQSAPPSPGPPRRQGLRRDVMAEIMAQGTSTLQKQLKGNQISCAGLHISCSVYAPRTGGRRENGQPAVLAFLGVPVSLALLVDALSPLFFCLVCVLFMTMGQRAAETLSAKNALTRARPHVELDPRLAKGGRAALGHVVGRGVHEAARYKVESGAICTLGALVCRPHSTSVHLSASLSSF
ncbi:uncharacterized protein BKA78DRAFT_299545 [Phyllosticta capitalensis]|uniref:Uncharacterized protein n=1 Tax=Phyllosticta capitalensis TaxID=121624 RepID=A0ABR1YFI0_9PEZI